MVNEIFPLSRRALKLLATSGLSINEARFLEGAREYHALCSTWNLSAKLLSQNDLASRFDDHIADSLSLAPYVMSTDDGSAVLVDIGAGAGLPSIPICLLLPTLSAILIERSETKATFLRQAVKRLTLEKATVTVASYPRTDLPEGPLVYTARAIEQPKEVDRAILRGLRVGDRYLAQRDIVDLPEVRSLVVEKLDDEFTTSGLRRGVLYRIQRQVPRGT